MELINLIWALLGVVAGAGLYRIYTMREQTKRDTILKDAHEEAEAIRAKAMRELKEHEEKSTNELKDREEKSEKRLAEREERLEKKEIHLDNQKVTLEKKHDAIEDNKELLKQREDTILQSEHAHGEKLAEIAKLTPDEAKTQIITHIEKTYSDDLITRTKKLEEQNKEALDGRARDILVSSIQRLASSTASEVTTTAVNIPDDMKGMIIGREGKNIRAFERAAGVEVIVDDTPGAITISSFDPIRRQIARVALENLILDGRMQPARIEEFVENAQKDINEIIKKKGEWAVHELGVLNFDPRIVAILGRLWFRYSYGQNVLQHSVEMAHVAAMIAEEVGADVSIVKAGALVHDIGKALDHEVQGTHVEIGIRLLRKFNVDERIVTAMKSHHDDYPHESLESLIVQTADIISGARPGARRDSLENYIKRLKELEETAATMPGVDRAYALSAGREVRVFVSPKKVSDFQAKKLAQDLVEKIEANLRYPGEIKVHVIRENRIVEYAR